MKHFCGAAVRSTHLRCDIWIFLLIIFILFADSAIPVEPLTHQAARLLHPALHDGEQQGGEYGQSRGNAQDMYVRSAAGVVKIYRPRLFSILRDGAGVDERMFQCSVDPEQLVSLSADSKSGQAFWRSSDGLIVLKTIKHYECINLRQVIDPYAIHVLHDHSCIAGVLGLYRIRMRNSRRSIYLLACKNVYHSNHEAVSSGPRTRYDLKGSTVGRAKALTSSVYKDLDLMHANRFFQLGSSSKPTLLHALQRDTRFLSHNNFMDYSLLVDVEEEPKEHVGIFRRIVHQILPFRLPRSIGDKGKLVLRGSDNKIYHFGIIDFLQKYTFRKWLETLLKGCFHDWRKISCVPSSYYASRMLQFIDFYTN